MPEDHQIKIISWNDDSVRSKYNDIIRLTGTKLQS